MFAIVQSGGKQYRVTEGDVLRLELLKAEPGDTVDLPIMMLGGDEVKVGTPLLEGSSVKAEIVAHGRGEKLYIRKFKAKNNYRRTTGHRQAYTEVRITELPGKAQPAKKAEAEAPKAEAAEPEAPKAATQENAAPAETEREVVEATKE